MKINFKSLVWIIAFFCFFINSSVAEKISAQEVTESSKEESNGTMPVTCPSGVSAEQALINSSTLNIILSSDKEAALVESVGITAGSMQAVYSKVKNGLVYTKDGQEIVISLQDVFGDGQSAYLGSLGVQDGDALTVTFATVDGSNVCFLTKIDNETKVKEWEYDVASRQVVYFHTEGVLAGKPDYVVQENGGWFRWADNNSADPAHKDQVINTGLHSAQDRQFAEHFVAQKYFYNSQGNLTLVEFYTSTGGTGTETGQSQVYGRYTYRADTYNTAGEKSNPVYYNDPYPGNWDPEIQGTIIQDSFGRYFLEESDYTRWLIIARDEGSLDGAGLLNSFDLSQLVESKTIVKLIGHEYENDIIYFNQKQTRIIAVTDGEVISPVTPVEVPEVRVITELFDDQSGSVSWQADSGNQQTVGIIVDNENPQDSAVVWEWKELNSYWYGWGQFFPESSALTRETLSNLVLEFAVSGSPGSDFTFILEDNSNFKVVDGTTVGHEISFKLSDYVSADYNLQLVAIPLNELAALNHDFDWSSIKQLKFTPSSDTGRVIIQQFRIEDVSEIRSRGMSLSVFQNNNFTPINDWYGVKPAYVMSFKDLFDIVEEDILTQLQAVSNNSQIPYLTLEFWQMESKSDEQMQLEKEKFVLRYGEEMYDSLIADIQNNNILVSVKAGVYDAIIRDYAKAAAALDKPMLLRLFHEFNGAWYPWAIDGNREDDLVAAWNKVYNIFQEEGAGKVSFVFSPYSLNYQGYDPVERVLSQLKDKIDIIAFDGYGPNDANPKSPGFSGLFTELYLRLEKYNLPFMIGEFGSEIDKTEFYQEMDKALRNGAFPNLIAITYFDITKFENGKVRDFGVSTVADVIQGIQQDQFYRLGPDAGGAYLKAYGQFTHYYWGDYMTGDMQAEAVINTQESGQKHIIVSVKNNILSVSAVSGTGNQIYKLDLVGGILETATGNIIPSLSPAQYQQTIFLMYQLIGELSAQATGVEKQKSLAVADYLNAIIYRLDNPDVSEIAMPLVPSSGITDSSGKINIVFESNTSLFPDQLAGLWAEVKVDGTTQYWDIGTGALSTDGKSLSLQFDSSFKGKTAALRIYGFDKQGKQTAFSHTVNITIPGAQTSVTMPVLPAMVNADVNGKAVITFAGGTVLPGQLSQLWAEVKVGSATQYWNIGPGALSTDGKSLSLQFDSSFQGKTVAMRIYGFDTNNVQTAFSNNVNITVPVSSAAPAMPVLPSTLAADNNGKAVVIFASGTILPSQLSQLWAEVKVDNSTQYWDIGTGALSIDGKSVSLLFDSTFKGKTVALRIYGFDTQGKQTAFSNTVNITIPNAQTSVTMPVLPATVSSDVNGKAVVTFASGTILPSQLSQLWAEVKVDSTTQYWDIGTGALSTDGKSLNLKFDSSFQGKTVALRIYGFNTNNVQTAFSNTVNISIPNSNPAPAMPTLPSALTADNNGNAVITFIGGTILPAQLSQLWVEITVDGSTQYWDIGTGALSANGLSLSLKFDASFKGKTIAMRIYGFDTQGKQTAFSNTSNIMIP